MFLQAMKLRHTHSPEHMKALEMLQKECSEREEATKQMYANTRHRSTVGIKTRYGVIYPTP